MVKRCDPRFCQTKRSFPSEACLGDSSQKNGHGPCDTAPTARTSGAIGHKLNRRACRRQAQRQTESRQKPSSGWMSKSIGNVSSDQQRGPGGVGRCVLRIRCESQNQMTACRLFSLPRCTSRAFPRGEVPSFTQLCPDRNTARIVRQRRTHRLSRHPTAQ